MMDLQTVADWELLLLEQRCEATAEISWADPRIRRDQVHDWRDWGQTEKARAVDRVAGTYVGFPNDDAYYAPRYLELMLAAAAAAVADLVICDWVSAGDAGQPYARYFAATATGHIDVGGFLVRRSLMQTHGWPDRGPTGDGALVESLVRQGARVAKVPAVLYVKN